MCELGYADYAYTLTLTYAEEFCPFDGELVINDIQRFFKRLRKASKGVKYKYYYCGEYGEKVGRPHFHCILFAYTDIKKPEIKEKIKACWRLGNVYIDRVSGGSVRYTLDYLQKDYWRFKGKKKQEPFQRMSKNIGKEYFLQNEDVISEREFLIVKGVKHRVPRYARKVSEKIKTKLRESFERRLKSEELDESESYKFYRDKCNDVRERAQQVERNIKQRKKIKRGGL